MLMGEKNVRSREKNKDEVAKQAPASLGNLRESVAEAFE